jgi:hypothetical protein
MKLRFPFFALCALIAAGQALPARAQGLLNAPPAKADPEQQLAKIESVPQLLALGDKFDAAGDWRRYGAVMERVLQLRPYAENVKFELAAAHAMQDDLTGAYDILLKLKDSGLAFKPWEDERFAKAQGTRAWDYIVDSFKSNGQPFGTGKTAFELPKDDPLIEGLAYDPARKEFLAGSSRDGSVLRVDPSGKTRAFIASNDENKLWGVSDLAVDAGHDLLWLVSSATPMLKEVKPDDLGSAGLFKFQLSSGKFLGRYLLEGRHTLTGIALSPAGEVYVAEADARTVYKLREDKLQLALGNPKLTSIRGMAVSGDGKILYLADYELGLFGIDIATGAPFALSGPATFSQFGIDGIYWYQGCIVAVQNGIPPKRVMRLRLSDDGRHITQTQPLDANKPEFVMPTRGTIADDHLYFIANNQRGQYDRYGIARDASKLRRVTVYASDVRFAWDGKEGEVKPLGK